MPLPPGFLDELRARLPVSEVVGRRVPLQRSGRELKACCPFHKEKSPSFTVNDQKGFFHCFGCGAHGDAIGFVMQHDRLGFMEAVELLATQAGLGVPQATGEERAAFERRKTLHDLVEAACRFFEDELRGPAGRPALAYLQRRGLDDDTIARFRLGYAPGDARLIRHLRGAGFADAMIEEAGLARKPDDGRDLYAFFRSRVMFPVADQRGRVVAFGGRILEGEGAKYINSPDGPLFHKGKLLYGLSRAREAAAQGQTVIVAEGYMDVIALVRAGFEAVVAPLGTALTEDQMGELWRLQPSGSDSLFAPVLCFDGDEAGRRAAVRAMHAAMPLIAPGYSLRFCLLPQGEDPDSFVTTKGAAQFGQLVAASIPLPEMIWRVEHSGHQISNPDQLAHLRKRLIDFADLNSNSIIRKQYIQEFSDRCYNVGRAIQKSRANSLLASSPQDWTLFTPAAFRPKAEAMLVGLVILDPLLLKDYHDVLMLEIDYVNSHVFDLLWTIDKVMGENPDMASDDLKTSLLELGEVEGVSRIMKDVNLFPRRSEVQRERVRTTFVTVLRRYREVGLQSQIKSLASDLAIDFAQAKWDRLLELRRELERARRELYDR